VHMLAVGRVERLWLVSGHGSVAMALRRTLLPLQYRTCKRLLAHCKQFLLIAAEHAHPATATTNH
jgi:hypothetical protein